MAYSNVSTGKYGGKKLEERHVINEKRIEEIIAENQKKKADDDEFEAILRESEYTQPIVSPEASEGLQNVLDNAVKNPSVGAAMGVIEAIPPRPNTNQGVMSGPNVETLTDMDLVNRGNTSESAATSLREAINAQDQEAALNIMGGIENANIVLEDHKDYSAKVINQMNNLTTGMSSASYEDYINRAAEDLRTDPRSVAEYMSTWLTDFKTLESNGVPEAFSDAALHAVLHVLKDKTLGVKEGIKDDKQTEETRTEQENKNATVATHEAIGGIIEGAFKVKNGTPTTRAIGGALALRAVTDALGSVTYKDKTTENVNKMGLFKTELERVDDKDVYVTKLTEAGLNAAEELSELGNLVIPGMKRDVHSNPPLRQTGALATVSKQLQRKEDPNRRAGKAEDTNKGIHALNGVKHKINKDLAAKINDSLRNQEVVDILEGPNFINIEGIEWNGKIHKRRENGETYRVRYIVQDYINGQPNTNPGRKVPNPNYGNPAAEDSNQQWLVEEYHGDFAKDLAWNETWQWIANHVEDGFFYYTHFIGGAKRVHVDQTLGNYQSNKLARGLLEAAQTIVYNLTSQNDLVPLQAGILKKFGMNKVKHGSNKQIADQFNGIVRGWKAIQDAHTNAGGAGIAPELVRKAGEEEGWSSINAIHEGIKLFEYMRDPQNKLKEYRSGFITEIDGTANGVAINSMYAGDQKTGLYTGMLGADPHNDVYTLTTDMFLEITNNYSGSLGPKFSHIWQQLGAQRKYAKKPLMTFGYGAGEASIKNAFKNELWSEIENSAEFKGKLKEILKDERLFHKFVEDSAVAMQTAIGTNFPNLQSLSKVIAAIVTRAVELGVAPRTITDNNDFIEFGLSERVIDKSKSFKGSLNKKATAKQKSRSLYFNTFERVNDPAGKTYSKSAEIGTYKASKQAPVLVTQSMDSLVMMRTMDKMKKRFGNNFYAAQIFDGVMIPPKHAKAFSEALHKELIHLGKNYNVINNLLEGIYNTDPARFYDWAVKAGMEKKHEHNWQEIMRYALGTENTKEGMPAIYIYNRMKSEAAGKTIKTPHSVQKIINRLNTLRGEYVAKMNIEDMYQYGWDFPTRQSDQHVQDFKASR